MTLRRLFVDCDGARNTQASGGSVSLSVSHAGWQAQAPETKGREWSSQVCAGRVLVETRGDTGFARRAESEARRGGFRSLFAQRC